MKRTRSRHLFSYIADSDWLSLIKDQYGTIIQTCAEKRCGRVGERWIVALKMQTAGFTRRLVLYILPREFFLEPTARLPRPILAEATVWCNRAIVRNAPN